MDHILSTSIQLNQGKTISSEPVGSRSENRHLSSTGRSLAIWAGQWPEQPASGPRQVGGSGQCISAPKGMPVTLPPPAPTYRSLTASGKAEAKNFQIPGKALPLHWGLHTALLRLPLRSHEPTRPAAVGAPQGLAVPTLEWLNSRCLSSPRGRCE